VSPSNQTVLSGPFYQWNPIFDEQTYVQTLATNFANAGVPGLGFIM
jgi:cellulase/cellobiase CelA1